MRLLICSVLLLAGGVAADLPLVSGMASWPQPGPYPNRISAPSLYPEMRSAWLAGPLDQNSFLGLSHPHLADDEQIAAQRVLLQRTRHPLVRSHAVMRLSASDHYQAVRLLLDVLPQEPNAEVRTDLLRALHLLQVDRIPELVVGQLHDAEPGVRRQAICSYLAQQKPDLAVALQFVAREPDAEVRLAAWRALAAHRQHLAVTDWLPLWQSDDPDLRRLAVAQAVAYPAASAYLERFMALTDGPIPVRFALAQGIGSDTPANVAAALLQRLASDKISSVRATAATTVARLAAATLQPIVLTLLADREMTVRQAAAAALPSFPDGKSFAALCGALGDEHDWVQTAAREALITMSDHFDVNSRLGPLLASANRDVRRHACEVLEQLNSTSYLTELQALAGREKEADNLAAALRALIVADGDGTTADLIYAHRQHPDYRVRVAVARMVMKFGVRTHRKLLALYAVSDEHRAVRAIAQEAMGRLRAPEFDDVLVSILVRTKDERLGGHDRAIAAWSLGQLTELSDAALKRLQKQITDAVIPTEMGPVHDSDLVRIACGWALAQQASRADQAENTALQQGAQRVLALMQTDFSGDPAAAMKMPTSEDLRAYAYQAECLMTGTDPVPREMSVRRFRFDFRHLRDP